MHTKTTMSMETAKLIGAALGKWAYEDGVSRGVSGIEDQAYFVKWVLPRLWEGKRLVGFDCVAVEETDIWSGLHKEWFGNDADAAEESHPNFPLYDACFTMMYEQCGREMIAAKHWQLPEGYIIDYNGKMIREDVAMDALNKCETDA